LHNGTAVSLQHTNLIPQVDCSNITSNTNRVSGPAYCSETVLFHITPGMHSLFNPLRPCVHYNGHHMSAPFFNFWSISQWTKRSISRNDESQRIVLWGGEWPPGALSDPRAL